MAGAYNDVVEEDGSLQPEEDLASLIEISPTGFEVAAIVENMYGMIWYLAHALATQVAYQLSPNDSAREALIKGYVQAAQKQYKQGLAVSPTARYKER
jgi:hypothetical protein